MSGAGMVPILPEDLMFRFAQKLEFGDDTAKVADTAIRLSQRMIQDWMVVGRRPSGVCGACLILAARIHNFRRTVTEVVYIVKVTTATIQKRMEEFKLTPSASLTVDEFLHTEFLESSHDPPSFYQKQEEFIKNKKTRKRKRKGQLVEDDEEDGQEADDAGQNKRQKTATPNPDQALPTVELRKDADGYAIPAKPTPAQPVEVPEPQSEFEDIVDETAENPTDESLSKLVQKFGDIEARANESDDEDDAASPTSSTTSIPKRDRRFGPRNPDINVPEEWARDEERIENDILELISDPKNSETIFDPNTRHHATLFAMAEKRSQKHKDNFERANPRKEISDEQEISESEFADDPEVQNCLLNAADIAKKEKVWVNENKNWLRKQQIKAYQKRMAANGPPKRTRNRTKGIRIGELQTSPASSAGEAATTVMQKRALSKKINYQNIESLFDDMDAPGGGALGSAATSRVTSRAGSSVPESPSATDSPTNDLDSEMGERPPQAESSTSRISPRAPHSASVVDDEVVSDDEDYVHDDGHQQQQPEEQQDQDSWKLGNRDRGVDEGEDEEGFPDDNEDDYGEDIGDGGLDDLGSDDGYGMNDDDG
jgi:transcription factor IIIB subunit 2